MLTFKTMILCTVLLLVPVFLAFRNMLRQRDDMLFHMLLGYIGCYFMKNFYALLNRAVNGIENDGIEMDWVAMLATVSFLVAAWCCLRHTSGEGESRFFPLKRELQVFLLVGIIAVLVESFAGMAGIRILFVVCYLLSLACAYAVSLVSAKSA